MSELIAEARVLVTPDTTKFRALLTAELTAATKGIVVPIAVTPATTGTTASTAAFAAAQAELAAASGAVTTAAIGQEQAVTAVAAAETRGATAARTAAAAAAEEAAARRAATVAAAAHARTLSGLTRGAGASALSMLGLRGATLASTGPFLAGAAAIVTFTKSLQTAANLETSLNTFAVTAGATADQMQRISDVAQQLGTDLTLPGVTANSAADALTELSKAGLSVEDSIAGVRGTLQLATAANIDNATATNLVASALNAFSLAGADASKVADLLAASSRESQGSITDVGLALQQSAAAAAQAGISVEDTIALLTELGRAGLKGSDAGTSLRVALLRLINPSKQAAAELKKLGVEIRDEAGNVRPEAFTDLTEQLSRFTNAQRDATLALIFGQDAFRAAAIIGRNGARGLNEMRDATQEVGVASELASARTKGLSGSIENLKNQVQETGLQIGEALNTPTKDFVDILAGGFQNINSAISFLGRLGESTKDAGDSAETAAQQYADLVRELGKQSNALRELEARGAHPQQSLIDDVQRLTEELKAQTPAGLTARDAIDAYAASVHNAALESEGLRNRIDETNDRFARTPPPPPAPTGPIAIGPSARLNRQAEIAASNDDLKDLERVQEILLTNAQKALANSKGNVKKRTQLFNNVTNAQAALNSTRRQIENNAIAEAKRAQTEAERRKREAEAAQQKADQAVLDSFAPAQSRLDLRSITVSATERLSDDLALQGAIIAEAKREERIIRATVQSVETRNAALRDQAKIIRTAETERATLIREIAKQATENRQKAANAVQTFLANQITLAELRENDQAEVTAINKAIANARKRIANYKKLGLNLQEEKIALEELINKRDDVLGTAKDAGTTLVDLFKSTQDIFDQAGTVGRLPSQLTSNAANAPIRDLVQQRLDIQLSNPTAEGLARTQTSTTERLISTMEQLIQVIGPGTGIQVGGNQGTGVGAGLGKALDTAARFRYQRIANSIVEGGIWG